MFWVAAYDCTDHSTNRITSPKGKSSQVRGVAAQNVLSFTAGAIPDAWWEKESRRGSCIVR
jgi:hypothetical protein